MNILDPTHGSDTRQLPCLLCITDRWFYVLLFKRWGKIMSSLMKAETYMLLGFTAWLRVCEFVCDEFSSYELCLVQCVKWGKCGLWPSRIVCGEPGLTLHKLQSTFSSLPLGSCKNGDQYIYHLHLLLWSSSHRGNTEGILKAGRGKCKGWLESHFCFVSRISESVRGYRQKETPGYLSVPGWGWEALFSSETVFDTPKVSWN